jgi:hypothetical protein
MGEPTKLDAARAQWDKEAILDELAEALARVRRRKQEEQGVQLGQHNRLR